MRAAPQDSGAVRAAVCRWLAARPALQTVASYAPLAEEVDLLPLLAWDPGRRWVFPRVCGDHLALHEVRDANNDLQQGAFAIREPSPALPVVPICDVDVFLCPGLAFDPIGGRLGRGRGYYDRMLAHARSGTLKVGICHPIQRVPDTFPQAHDVFMDVVISSSVMNHHTVQ